SAPRSMPAGTSDPRAALSTRSRQRTRSSVKENGIDVDLTRAGLGTEPLPDPSGTLPSPSRSKPCVNSSWRSPDELTVTLEHALGHSVAPEQRGSRAPADAWIRLFEVPARQCSPFCAVKRGAKRPLDSGQRQRRNADVRGQNGHVAGERLE